MPIGNEQNNAPSLNIRVLGSQRLTLLDDKTFSSEVTTGLCIFNYTPGRTSNFIDPANVQTSDARFGLNDEGHVVVRKGAVFDYEAAGNANGHLSVTFTITINGQSVSKTMNLRITDVEGNPGPNVIYGTEGRDTLRGTIEDDIIYGLGGHDRIDGGRGDDALYGGTGDDWLWGNGGDDVLNGGEGNDLLKGSALYWTEGCCTDLLTGGKGEDVFWVEDPNTLEGADIVTDFTQGEDKLRFDSDTREIFVTQVGQNLHLKDGRGDDAKIYAVLQNFSGTLTVTDLYDTNTTITDLDVTTLAIL